MLGNSTCNEMNTQPSENSEGASVLISKQATLLYYVVKSEHKQRMPKFSYITKYSIFSEGSILPITTPLPPSKYSPCRPIVLIYSIRCLDPYPSSLRP